MFRLTLWNSTKHCHSQAPGIWKDYRTKTQMVARKTWRRTVCGKLHYHAKANNCLYSIFLLQGEDSEESAVALNLKSVEGVFYVTAGGVLLSVIFVFVEMVVHNFKKSLRKKIPFKESVKEELIFYTKFGENVKPVIQRSLSKSRSKSVEDDENCLCEEKQERVYGFIPEFLPQEDKDENQIIFGYIPNAFWLIRYCEQTYQLRDCFALNSIMIS